MNVIKSEASDQQDVWIHGVFLWLIFYLYEENYNNWNYYEKYILEKEKNTITNVYAFIDKQTKTKIRCSLEQWFFFMGSLDKSKGS